MAQAATRRWGLTAISARRRSGNVQVQEVRQGLGRQPGIGRLFMDHPVEARKTLKP
jgi:hypothetical protein